jgi:carbon storage regulator CsrA
MLVLTRKTNESIIIDGAIEVMVVQVRGNRVRLGFRAPSNISIQRRERLPQTDDSPAAIVPERETCYSGAAPRRSAAFAARPR